LDTPVTLENRIDSVDVLRGFALLGILVINIGMFGLPQIAINNPSLAGGADGADLAVWTVSRVVFFQKFMAIFSMLFGAGLILMYQRAETAGKVFGKTYYRRLGWLLAFGMVHGYFIWWGDILYHYAVCGMVLYPLRRWSSRRLITFGVILFFVGSLFFFGLGLFLDFCRGTVAEAEAAQAAGENLTSMQESMVKVWERVEPQLNPPQEKIKKEIEKYQGGYWQVVAASAPIMLSLQTVIFVLYIFWRAAGLMLIGMGLMKLGVFAAQRSRRFYLSWIIAGYGLGLPISAYIIYKLIASDFDMLYNFGFYAVYDSAAVLLITTGHIGLVMSICQSGVLKRMRQRLAAVGRMALSNYMLDSLIMAPIFYGYGLGLYGRINYFGLSGIVLAIWILQLYLSPLWLRYFRFGPAEWLWRSLTYRHKQPMRVAVDSVEGGGE